MKGNQTGIALQRASKRLKRDSKQNKAKKTKMRGPGKEQRPSHTSSSEEGVLEGAWILQVPGWQVLWPMVIDSES